MAMRPLLLLPEIVLFLGGLAVLVSGSFLPRTRQWVTRVIAAVALVAAAILAVVDLPGPAQPAMEGTFTVDTATWVARIVAALGTLIVLALASDEIAGSPRESETYALLLFSTTGTLVLAGADDPSRVQLVQFHPSYAYEDFFEGFRPALRGDGQLAFKLHPGPFRRLVDAAR